MSYPIKNSIKVPKVLEPTLGTSVMCTAQRPLPSLYVQHTFAKVTTFPTKCLEATT